MKKVAPLLILLGVALIAALVWSLVKFVNRPAIQITATEETWEKRNAALKRAFGPGDPEDPDPGSGAGTSPPVDPAQFAEVAEFFQSLSTALANNDRKTIKKLVSCMAMAVYMSRSGMLELPPEDKLSRAFTIELIASSLMDGFLEKDSDHRFSDPVLRYVETLSPKEVIAYLEIKEPDGTHRFRRWWLVRHPDGGWQAYDFETLEISLRESQWNAAFQNAAFSQSRWSKEWDAFLEVAYQDDKVAEALKLGKSLLKRELPEPLEVYALVAYSDTLSTSGKGEEAITYLDRAVEVSSGDAMVHFERAQLYEELGDYKNAVIDLEIYSDTYGWADDWARYTAIECYGELGDEDSVARLEKISEAIERENSVVE